VYTDPSLFVACNWSGESGKTGASFAGTSLSVCGSTFGGPFRPLFSSMPTLILRHEYILLVSHFTATSQSGYSLAFGTDTTATASITDFKEPNLASARAICDGIKMTVKLNKRMKCSSLNADGSDFTVTPAIAPIIAAEGVNCSTNFDMDSIVLTLATPIPPGNYQITIKNDTAGINLLDNCNRVIPLGQFLPVTVFPLIPTLMDSITPFACAPDSLVLVFKKPMQCSTIAANGSDFTVIGNTGVKNVTGAFGNCNDQGLTNIIIVKLAVPIQKAGNYRITLQTGTDGNTILNECGQETPAGSFLPFIAWDTVSANFKYTIKFGCKIDTIDFSHDGRNGVNKWLWIFDSPLKSNAKDTSITYSIFNDKIARLVVSNGVCSDTSAIITVKLDNTLKAVFEATANVCPGDPAIFKDNSFNNVTGWQWTFGNGETSILKSPPLQLYPSSNSTRDIPVRLIVSNSIGCFDTALNTIRVVGNCYIAVPKAFTPNADGLNDFLYPTNSYKAKDLYFAVYNRVGQKLFETTDWTNKWNGYFKGNPQDPGTYVWLLKYTHIETGQRFNLKGTTVLIR
jgi:gliding motility-associated-like protein